MEIKMQDSQLNGRVCVVTGSALMAHYSAANTTVNCICQGITEATGVWSHVSEAYTKNMNLDLDTVKETFASKVPLKRLTRVSDVVNFVLFLATRADYCTGQAFNITGGREVH